MINPRIAYIDYNHFKLIEPNLIEENGRYYTPYRMIEVIADGEASDD